MQRLPPGRAALRWGTGTAPWGQALWPPVHPCCRPQEAWRWLESQGGPGRQAGACSLAVHPAPRLLSTYQESWTGAPRSDPTLPLPPPQPCSDTPGTHGHRGIWLTGRLPELLANQGRPSPTLASLPKGLCRGCHCLSPRSSPSGLLQSSSTGTHTRVKGPPLSPAQATIHLSSGSQGKGPSREGPSRHQPGTPKASRLPLFLRGLDSAGGHCRSSDKGWTPAGWEEGSGVSSPGWLCVSCARLAPETCPQA